MQQSTQEAYIHSRSFFWGLGPGASSDLHFVDEHLSVTCFTCSEPRVGLKCCPVLLWWPTGQGPSGRQSECTMQEIVAVGDICRYRRVVQATIARDRYWRLSIRAGGANWTISCRSSSARTASQIDVNCQDLLGRSSLFGLSGLTLYDSKPPSQIQQRLRACLDHYGPAHQQDRMAALDHRAASSGPGGMTLSLSLPTSLSS